MSLKEIQTNFEKKSVLIFLLLSVVTLWIYALVWYIRVSKTLNRLLPENRIPTTFIIVCSIFTIVNVAFVPIEIMTDDDPAVMRTGNLVEITERILAVIWTFMLRSRINVLRADDRYHWLNGLATLLLGPFYIQYKLNRMIDASKTIYGAEQVAQADASSASR